MRKFIRSASHFGSNMPRVIKPRCEIWSLKNLVQIRQPLERVFTNVKIIYLYGSSVPKK